MPVKIIRKKPGNVIPFPEPNVALTEDNIAEDFASHHADKFRFDADQRTWHVWNDLRWEPDRTGKVFYQARLHCRKHRGSDKKMASRSSITGVEALAKSDPRLRLTSDIWNADPFLLGTPGGTVDLRTGQLRPAKMDDFITKLTLVTPAEPSAPFPRFEAFLEQITRGDKELERFLQRWFGYCLTGDTREQVLVFIHGPGGNGKGVLVNTLASIMGDYAKTAAMETFTASRQQRHLTELAMLHGARLVNASETEKGHTWAESRINQLTGADPVTANFMRRDHFTYRPQFKITLIGNHTPKLGTVNEAARRRFIIVPFIHKPEKPDLQLAEKLEQEHPAILRWMIDGCLDWQENGLVKPAVVSATTAEYFDEQDLFGRWIEEQCETGPGDHSSAGELYQSWKNFAERIGEEPGSITAFGNMLRQRGFQKKKASSVRYLGIKPKSDS
jgi:putative DNA primase/helicase